MTARLSSVPFFVLLIGMSAAAMVVPSAHALIAGDHATSRAFGYSALLLGVAFALFAVALSGRPRGHPARGYLLTLVASLTVLPVLLALPVYESIPELGYFDAWFEMVASVTTTGASLLRDPGVAPESVHLWRALVGWLGGFFTLLVTVAILAPMSLGGFELSSPETVGRGAAGDSPITRVANPEERLAGFFRALFPVYAALTLLLWVALVTVGETPLVAACHAMSALATSGISPVQGMVGTESGIGGEMLIFLFLIFALSRQTFVGDGRPPNWRGLASDPELRLAAVLVTAVPLLLFARHWSGAFEGPGTDESVEAVRAFWGSLFTVMSFLTTTGFESTAWRSMQLWSALETPGLILMGLALIGGGVATTAGGVKLLRVYALYKHGLREMERLVHPSSVGGAGPEARRIRRQGAYAAWIFFMLFALSVALVFGALALTGLAFEDAVVLTVAALSTTGPLAWAAAETPIDYAELAASAKTILAAAMVLGRLETLALVALLNPDFWRG